MLEKIGEFDVVSGEVRVSDPCYDLDVWCSGSVPAINGRWSAMVERRSDGWWGERIERLIVEHDDYAGAASWQKLEFQVGVDSGQAGVFDLSHYRDDSVAPAVPAGKERFIPDEPWYSACCEITLSKGGSGVISFGAVSTSGYGDGGYDGFAVFVDGKAVAVMIVFIEDDDDDDDYGWDDEEE